MTRKLVTTLPIYASYFPVASGIWIEDSTKRQQMIVMPRYSAGGSSGLINGGIEVMINRQTNKADGINGQPLLENENPKPLATFTFAWTKNREQLFDIHRETYLENTYPLYM
jgi:hypothetical protein